jgi:xanthine dehydrogenase molybdopterin-binding subunit B
VYCLLRQDAIAANSFFPTTGIPSLVKGDVDTALAASAHVVSGQVTLTAQQHMYMEVQNAVAKYTEDGMEMTCSTQVCVCVCRWAAFAFYPLRIL